MGNRDPIQCKCKKWGEHSTAQHSVLTIPNEWHKRYIFEILSNYGGQTDEFMWKNYMNWIQNIIMLHLLMCVRLNLWYHRHHLTIHFTKWKDFTRGSTKFDCESWKLSNWRRRRAYWVLPLPNAHGHTDAWFGVPFCEQKMILFISFFRLAILCHTLPVSLLCV